MRLKRPTVQPKLIGLSLLFLFVPVLVFVGVAGAQEFRSGDTTTVGGDEVVNSALWTAGRTIDVAGEVQGDLFCAGQNVAISGTVAGDVICAAQTINISGVVEGDIRVAAQTLTIGGDVAGSATAMAQKATVESEGTIGNDAAFAAQDAVVHGTVTRDLALGVQVATLSGGVGRNITATVDDLRLTNDATVGGAIDYTSSNEAQIADSAQVAGDTTRFEPTTTEASGSNFGFMLFVSLVLLVTALALVLLFPKAFHSISGHAFGEPLKTFLVGLAATFVVPVLIIGIMITVVGIPLGLLALLMWILILALSGAFAAYYLGRLVWREQTNPVLIMLAGAAILLVLRFIPILGVLAVVLAVWFGTGMILIELQKRFAKPAYNTKSLK